MSWWRGLERNCQDIGFLKEGTVPVFSPLDLQCLAKCSQHSRLTVVFQMNALLKETRRRHYRSQSGNTLK